MTYPITKIRPNKYNIFTGYQVDNFIDRYIRLLPTETITVIKKVSPFYRKLPYIGLAYLAYDVIDRITNLDSHMVNYYHGWTKKGNCNFPPLENAFGCDQHWDQTDGTPEFNIAHTFTNNCLGGQALPTSTCWNIATIAATINLLVKIRPTNALPRFSLIESFWRNLPAPATPTPQTRPSLRPSTPRVAPRNPIERGIPTLLRPGISPEPSPFPYTGFKPKGPTPVNPVPPYRQPSTKKPPRGTKERKVNVVNKRVYQILNLVTESIDVLDAFYDALPDDLKVYRPSPQEKFAIIYKNIDRLDLDQAFVNLVTNQIEDYLFGRAGDALGDAASNNPVYEEFSNRGYGTGPAI